MDETLTFTTADVTCRTAGCENETVTIRLQVVADAATRYVVCGPCGDRIDDVE
ncbi:hypothetical protein SAMN05660766_2251 [Curtobacterium sp. 314Chir4.1]|nr:hypothetical protein SAMN05660766_2251 [Curtobacterium sp. 314Chir4.1]